MDNPMQGRRRRLKDLAAARNPEALETAWIEAADAEPENLELFMEAVAVLETEGRFEKAGSYLALLLPIYLERRMDDHALTILRKMAAVSPRERGIRHGFLDVFRRRFASHPDFETLLGHSGLDKKEADLLAAVDRLETWLAYRKGAYVEHPAGWGMGRIVDVDPAAGTVVIDFRTKPRHELSLDVARKVTEIVPDDDLRAMKSDRLEELRALAASDPARLIRIVVKSRGGRASVREIKQRLCDDVIPAKDWTRFWSRARTACKADLFLRIGTETNALVEILAASTSPAEIASGHLAALEDLPARIKYLRTLLTDLEAHPDAAAALRTAAEEVARTALAGGPHPLGHRISLALVLAQVAGRLDPPLDISPDLAPDTVFADPAAVAAAVPELVLAAHERPVLHALRERATDTWMDLYETIVLFGLGDISEVAAKELIAAGAFDRVTRVIVREILDGYRDRPDAFLWFARLAAAGKLPPELPNPGLTVLVEKAVLLHAWITSRTALRSDPGDRRALKAVQNWLISRRGAVVSEALHAASDPAEAQNVYSVVRRNRTLQDDARDILVAAALRVRPDLARDDAATADPEFDFDTLYVTPGSLRRRELDYERLVNVEIPENAREIGKAASYGDLSENFEWSSAIARRDQLVHRAEILRADLDRARVIEDDMFIPGRVSLGARVALRLLSTGETETWTILGPWEIDRDRRVISYQSPIGRALMGRSVGDRVTIELPGGHAEAEILSIERDDDALGAARD